MNIANEVWPNGPFSLPDEGEFEKQLKKLNIVRNQFKTVGKFEMPFVKKDEIDLKKLDLWGYTKTKMEDDENAHKAVHFFTYDWLYENVFAKPEKAMEKLEQYYALLTPDFSVYLDMPLAVQIYNTFKNRWCGAYWQSMGKKVIPTIEWGDERSFDFCFDGVEVGSVVAVSTYAREMNPQEYLIGYNKMLEVINPKAIICYGEKLDGMEGNVVTISPFDTEEMIKQMGFEKFMEKYLDGTLYPSK